MWLLRATLACAAGALLLGLVPVPLAGLTSAFAFEGVRALAFVGVASASVHTPGHRVISIHDPGRHGRFDDQDYPDPLHVAS